MIKRIYVILKPIIALSSIIIKMEYLYISCPVGHHNGCTSISPSYWYHSGCGGRTMIDYDSICLQCSSCSIRAIIFNWNFSCQNHGFKESSKLGWIFALSKMNQGGTNQAKIIKAIQKIQSY